MYYSLAVKVLNGANDAPHQLGGVSFSEELLLADPVEELATAAEISDYVHCRGK